MAGTRRVRLPPADTAPDPCARPADLVRYVGTLVWVALQLQAGAEPASLTDLHARLVRELARARGRADLAGFGRPTIDDAAFATVALLDAAILSTPGPRSAAWAGRPLELAVFGTSTAGTQLRPRLEAALARDDRDALAVFRLCLASGLDLGDAPPAVACALVERVDHVLGIDPTAAIAGLRPRALPPPPPPRVPRTGPWWVGAAGIVVVSGVVALVVIGAEARALGDDATAALALLEAAP